MKIDKPKLSFECEAVITIHKGALIQEIIKCLGALGKGAAVMADAKFKIKSRSLNEPFCNNCGGFHNEDDECDF